MQLLSRPAVRTAITTCSGRSALALDDALLVLGSRTLRAANQITSGFTGKAPIQDVPAFGRSFEVAFRLRMLWTEEILAEIV